MARACGPSHAVGSGASLGAAEATGGVGHLRSDALEACHGDAASHRALAGRVRLLHRDDPVTSLLKSAVLATGRAVLRHAPRGAARRDGRLAIDGGTPVRDIRWRPWAPEDTGRRRQWWRSVEPALRDVFVSGIEGLPQPRQRLFSEQWAAFCRCRHALLLPHGTDALRFALAAVLDHDGLDYGGEVIVPNLSFIASATAAWDRRFGVALVDVDPATLNLNPQKVEEAIVHGRTKAIMPVHQFGQPADMSALTAIAQRHQLKIIEDA